MLCDNSGGNVLVKKIFAIFMVVVSLTFLIYCEDFIKKSGVFESYPQAEFLSLEDSEIRPVYSMLDNREKAIYAALYKGIAQKMTEIPLPYEISGDSYAKIYCIFEKQESSFFYIDSTYYTAEKIRNAKIVFREDTSCIDSKIMQLENKADSIVKNAPDGEYEKILYIHDYITETCKYNTGYQLEYSSTAYGCLVDGTANCEGYAKAFCYLAGKMGIKSILVTGKTNNGENHAWNQVEIDGDWYNVDITWDDMDNSGGSRKVYFLCNDEQFGKTHIAENSYFSAFGCFSDKNNYYVKNGLFATNNSEADFIVRREITAGNRIIELKFSNSAAYFDFKRDYIENQKIFDIILDSGYSTEKRMSIILRETKEEYCLTLELL